jgi:hypothetical protein
MVQPVALLRSRFDLLVGFAMFAALLTNACGVVADECTVGAEQCDGAQIRTCKRDDYLGVAGWATTADCDASSSDARTSGPFCVIATTGHPMCSTTREPTAECERQGTGCQGNRVVFCTDGFPTSVEDCAERVCNAAAMTCTVGLALDPLCRDRADSTETCDGNVNIGCFKGYRAWEQRCASSCGDFGCEE